MSATEIGLFAIVAIETVFMFWVAYKADKQIMELARENHELRKSGSSKGD